LLPEKNLNLPSYGVNIAPVLFKKLIIIKLKQVNNILF
jgi:hypothetical protein